MKLRIIGFSLLIFFGLSTSAISAQFSYQFSETVSFSSIAGINVGDNAVITVTLDNGGTTNESQIWTSFDLAIVNFNFGDGALDTTFFSGFDMGLVDTVGSFSTDAMGNLITAPSNWSDSSITNDVTRNPSAAFVTFSWFINGGNEIYAEDETFISINNVGNIDDASFWTEVGGAAPVPVPAAVWLFGSALLGLIGLRRKQM